MPNKSNQKITKITVDIPTDLLRNAQRAGGKGISETVRQGLRLVAAGKAYQELRSLRGSLKLDLDLKNLREDR